MEEDELLSSLFSAEDVFGAQPAPMPSPMAQPGTEGMTGLDIERMLLAPEQQEEVLRQEMLQGRIAERPWWQVALEEAAEGFGPSAVIMGPVGPAIMGGAPLVAGEGVSRASRGELFGPQEEQPELDPDSSSVYGSDAMDPLTTRRLGGESPGPGSDERRVQAAYSSWREAPAPEGTLAYNGLPAAVVIQGEGLEHPIPISEAGLRNVDALVAELSAAQERGRNSNEVAGGALPQLNDEAIAAIARISVLPRLSAQGGGGAGGGPRVPGGQFTVRAQAPIMPGTQESLDLLQGSIGEAQIQGIQAQQAFNQGDQQTGMMMAEMQERLAYEAADQRDARMQLMQRRMEALDRSIEDVRSQRVDPNAFYGGAAGRITATVAVALGQLGSLLTGGPNVALQTIESGLERSMRSQEANLENARAAVGMQSTALNQYRAILGDEEAAQAATRSSLLEAYRTQLAAMMVGLRGPQLVAAQQLEALIAQRAMAEGNAAREREAFTAQGDIETSAQQALGLVQQAMTPPAAHPQADLHDNPPAEEPVDPLETAARNLYDEAETLYHQSDYEGSIEAFTRLANSLPEGDPRLSVVRQAIENVRAAEEGANIVPFDVAEPEPQAPPPAQRPRNPRPPSGGPRPPRAPSPRAARPAASALPRTFETQTAAEGLESLASFEERAERVTSNQPPYGLMLEEVQGSLADFRRRNASGDDTERYNSARDGFQQLQQTAPFILGIRQEYEGEILRSNRSVRQANAMLDAIFDEYRVSVTGAAAPPAELESLRARIPRVTEQNLPNLLNFYDSVFNELEAFFLERLGHHSRVLRNYGLVPDSRRGDEIRSWSSLRQELRSQRRAYREALRGREE